MRARRIPVPGVAVLATALLSGLLFQASVLVGSADADDNSHPVVLTFTKWITVTPGAPYMQGIVAGDGIVNSPGPFNFAGEVLVYNQSALLANLGPSIPASNRDQVGDITQLVAVYEVQSGDHSFRALVQGGDDNTAKHALLDGVVLGGWLAGEQVHVDFRDVQCSPARPEAASNNCFQGTITITPSPEH